MAAILYFTLHKHFTQKQHILKCFAFVISKAQVSVVSGVRACATWRVRPSAKLLLEVGGI